MEPPTDVPRTTRSTWVRGQGACARTLYAEGRHDDAFVADAFRRVVDPTIRRYRRLVAEDGTYPARPADRTEHDRQAALGAAADLAALMDRDGLILRTLGLTWADLVATT